MQWLVSNTGIPAALEPACEFLAEHDAVVGHVCSGIEGLRGGELTEVFSFLGLEVLTSSKNNHVTIVALSMNKALTMFGIAYGNLTKKSILPKTLG